MIDIKKFQLVGVEENKKPMENYMKNRYPFVGVKSPDRKKQSNELITESKLYSLDQLFQTINYLYQKEEREYQNVAIDMCEANVNRLSFEELQNYSQFIQLKSWWDTVDAWRKIYGLYIKRVPEEKEKMFYYFYQHENMWMRRVSITLQLMEKEKTNVELLEKAIMYDRYTDEFFIQKAIGWSLRQYSKVNPNWVVAFTSEKDLLPFAKKEALKQINK
ncbi:DNA alkylation repair protein [Vagococcus carniphilus]|uniref:6-O-methylguanine DNA methyltransferase n=1 Tax=Vagococcus carniphilus TaxID=218144 RepID=A0A430B7T8_9ENTE|nr:DNA alkylation repair protein [Vagococcus carniphilus]QNN74368.1 DNA alkylation repair protein [Vagococcus carniphilus]RSU16328.1 6-O-methylguanine DNA methyltransferase [Vagococcus carniphilus]